MGIYDDDGNPIEGFESKEQLQERLKELDDLKTQLEKMKDKETNFSKLRSQLEEKDKEKQELEEKLKAREEQEKNLTAKELKEAEENFRNEAFSSLGIEDEETKEKVLYHYNRISDEAKTREEVAKKMKDALVLATKDYNINPINKAANLSGRSGTSGVKRSDAHQEIGSRLKVNDEDVKKYSGDDWKPSNY